MKLQFHGHDDRYAIEQSLLAFFPEERPVYQAPEPGEDDWARVDLHQSPVYATAITEITYGGRLGRGMSRALLRGVDNEYERERLRQKAVKLSFFKAAREIAGLTPAWGALTGIRPGKLAARLLEEGKTPAQVRRILRDTYYVSPSRRRLADLMRRPVSRTICAASVISRHSTSRYGSTRPRDFSTDWDTKLQ